MPLLTSMRPLPIILCVALVGAALSASLVFKIGRAKKLVEAQLVSANARAAELESDLASAHEQNGLLKAGAVRATAELVASREKLSDAETRAGVLERDLTKTRGIVAVYEQTTRALSDEIASLKSDLSDTRATFASPDVVAAYKNTIAELERQLAVSTHGAAIPTAPGASTAVFASRVGRANVLTVGPSNAFVVLDFGSARGAALGQRLTIDHGTGQAATILISDVRTNFSIAQVQPDTLRGVLRKGDLALLIR